MIKPRYADTGEEAIFPFMDIEGASMTTKAELAAQVSGRVIEIPEPEDEGRSYSQFDMPEMPDTDIETGEL